MRPQPARKGEKPRARRERGEGSDSAEHEPRRCTGAERRRGHGVDDVAPLIEPDGQHCQKDQRQQSVTAPEQDIAYGSAQPGAGVAYGSRTFRCFENHAEQPPARAKHEEQDNHR